ncbi:MAG: hypothetical protein ABI548_11480 [Polyangiaceae bacterium]
MGELCCESEAYEFANLVETALAKALLLAAPAGRWHVVGSSAVELEARRGGKSAGKAVVKHRADERQWRRYFALGRSDRALGMHPYGLAAPG